MGKQFHWLHLFYFLDTLLFTLGYSSVEFNCSVVKDFFSRSVTREDTSIYLLSVCSNLVPFHLWWREIALKCEQFYKYSVQYCTLVNSEDWNIQLRAINIFFFLIYAMFLRLESHVFTVNTCCSCHHDWR